MRPVILFCALLAGALPARATPQVFSSAAARTHLLELYSSEGCSSCPSAEAWLGDLRTASGLWRDFVPVSFHVSYWDYLGWRDRFAGKVYTDRQYRYADAWGSGRVYTPCFVLDGRDTGPRLGGGELRAAAENAGVLSARVSDDGVVAVSFAPTRSGDYAVTVALLGADIVSAVHAGENSGRTLRHDFVALGLATAALRDGRAELRLPTTDLAGINRHAVAVWVTRRGALAPVQATGGWLDAGRGDAQ